MRFKTSQTSRHRLTKGASLYQSTQGFTLIELMISLTIGALLLTAATTLVSTGAYSRSLVKQMAELQEEAFFVTHTVRQQLAQTGYRGVIPGSPSARSIPIAARSNTFSAAPGDWSAGQVIKTNNNTLFYRFDGASLDDGTPDGSIYDCLGNLIPQGTLIESALSLQGNQLVCTVGSESTILIGGGQGIRVEQLAFSLGVDNDNDGGVDQIINSSVATNTDFINTRHLTMNMLLATRDGIVKNSQTYRYRGIETTATDNRLRTEVVISVAIRN